VSIISLKEVHRELTLAKKHFNQAIELARKNLIVGELKFEGEKPKRVRPSSPRKKATPKSEKDLPDGDANNPFYSEKKK
jgi:hypothetical protein